MIPIRSYNPSEFATPTASEFTEDALSPNWAARRSNSGKFASSLLAGRFDMASKQNKFPDSRLTTVNMLPGITEKDGGAVVEVQKERSKAGSKAGSKPLKETTKAERRALQEAQRAANAAAKGDGSTTPAASSGVVASANATPGKTAKALLQSKDSSPIAASEKQ